MELLLTLYQLDLCSCGLFPHICQAISYFGSFYYDQLSHLPHFSVMLAGIFPYAERALIPSFYTPFLYFEHTVYGEESRLLPLLQNGLPSPS